MADTNLNDFIINKLTQAQYDAAEKDPNQLYIVTDADKYQEKLTAGHNITINKNVISAADELPDQTGNMGKVLTTDGEKVGWVNPRIYNIFDYKWADHKLYDIRWLRADPYSWQWKSAYETAYNHLVNDGSTQNATFTLASDSTFKILAGSTICIPAGFEADGLTRKYTTVTIDTDTTIEHSSTDGWTGYLWYVPSSNTFSIGSEMFLPTTEIPTTSSGVYWNESSNKAERYENGVYQGDWSFPIMRMTSSSTQITGILEIYNGVNGFTKSTFTQNGITVTYYTATEDKHTICLPDQETNLESLFQATGKAWFYILDTQNERFKLPRDTNKEDSINNYLYFYVGDYTEDALKQVAGITAESLNDKVDNSQLDPKQPNTLLSTLLDAVYPVGCVYLSTTTSCPVAALIIGSEWELVSSGKALWTGNGKSGTGTTSTANFENAPANTTISAGAPNITGTWTTSWNNAVKGFHGLSTSGAFYDSYSSTSGSPGRITAEDSSNAGTKGYPWFDASRSNPTYGNSTTIQPPAYVVNAWRRIA